MPLPTPQRSSRRRGSVLILVVAVLVLLALMGTAYIATSRADRTASATSESTASVDALAKGVVDTLKTQLVNDRIDASNPAVGATLRNTATGYFAYNNAASTLRTDGLLTLSARVPVATGTTSPGDRPRWPFISSPLDASTSNPGSFANPAPNAPITAASFPGPTSTLNTFSWGRNERERRGADTNVIASVTLAADGRTYPAFFTVTNGLPQGYAIAADADGDGIADSGLSPLGTLPNADFSGITFFYGIRLIDNNSAFNANTAWTTGSDLTVAGAPGAVRNNRLFPAAIGLKESTTPREFGQLGPFAKLDPFDDEPNGFDLSAYRAGRFGQINSLANRARPVVDVDSSSGRSNLTVRRTDFQFNTQQELLYFQLARRLDFPGVHADAVDNSTFARFTPFTLAEQAQLAHGFVLAPKDVADTVYATALEKRPPIEQLLGGSLYRIAGYPSTPGLTLRIPTLAYPASQIGVRRTNPVASEWFSENFNYEVAGTGPDPLTVLNLRPLLVTQNPVAQSTTFKPLPLKAVLPPDSTYDVMHPYVPRWISGQRYNRGDIVFGRTSRVPPIPSEGQFYRSDFDGLTNSSADPASNSNHVPAGGATAARPWSIYDGPLVATKVDINTAPFGDLWRAFYLTFTSDFTIPTDTSGPFSSNGTVSHFEVPQLGNGTTNDVLTDSLEELYRGMGFSGGVATPTLARPNTASPAQNTYHPQRALRANVKDFVNTSGPNGHFTLPPAEMAKLRAAQAAANAEYLRIVNQIFSGVVPHSLTVRKIALRSSRATSADPDVAATVYSVGHFPYITEVYANNDGVSGGGANPGGYVAIELFNPYPFDISLDDWELHILPRTSGAAIPITGRATTLLLTFGPDAIRAIIPANGYLLLENYSSGADAAGTQPATIAPSPATVRPAGSGLPVTGDFRKVLTDIPVPPNALNRAYVPGLETLFGTNRGELVLLRPVNAFIIGNVQTAAPVSPRDPAQYAPVDSFDFTGFLAVSTATSDLTNYHYARRTDEWRFVYPGRYDGRSTSPLRQQGVIAREWNPIVPPGTEPIPGATLGGPSNPNANGTATYNTTFPIQIVNIGQGGFRAAVTDNSTNANSYPFGGFPRDLDILQVPFISPVRLRPISSGGPPDNVFELVSLTQDAAFAEDTDTHDNFEENVGRFTPIATPALAAAPADFSIIDDFSPQTFRHRYGFANRLLDHLTVRSSTRLNTPAVGPTSGTGQFSVANYPDSATNATRVQPVAAKPAAFTTPNAIITPDAGVQGLININTAPLPVLAAVPWVRSTDPTADRINNVLIARAIIAHRDANGPFRSIFQLNTVAGFRTLEPTLLPGMTTTPRGVEPGAAIGTVSAFTITADRSNDNGDFSPLADGTFPGNLNATPAADSNFPGTLGGTGAIASTFPLANPIGDYESQFLNLIAVSNLITTRSDTFTAYIVIEGWRNAGTSSATRVIQRRHAYILDRTGVAPGVPPQLLNMDLAAANDPTLHPVVTPFNASGPINRPVNTSVRATEIPVPSGP